MHSSPGNSETSLSTVSPWLHVSMIFKNHKGSADDSYVDDDTDEDDDEDDDDDDDDDDTTPNYMNVYDWYVADETAMKEEIDTIKRVVNNEAFCFDMRVFAEKFVDAILFEAKKIFFQRLKTPTSIDSAAPQMQKLLEHCRLRSSSAFSSVASNDMVSEFSVNWPKISEFNIKLGQEKLEIYVSNWELSDDWQFCVEFLGFESEDCSNIFVYEVEWSKPTMSYPIPQVTASVFFALEVYKMVPYNHDRSVVVSYIFECSSVIHVPGKIDFQEKWLTDIMEAKLKFFKTITFPVPKSFCKQQTPLPHEITIPV